MIIKSGKWYEIKMSDRSDTAELYLYDEIGGWGDTAKDVIAGIKQLKGVKRINVRINSPGGSVFDGFAIYNELVRNSAEIAVYIDGWAASIASIIAMSAEKGKIYMPSNAWMMIHNPWSIVIGDANEMSKMADVLDKMREQMVDIYQRHTSKSREEILRIMDEETWIPADDMKNYGFDDINVTEELQIAAKFNPDAYADKIKAPVSAMKIFNIPAAKGGNAGKNIKEENSMWEKILNILQGKGFSADKANDEKAVEEFVSSLKTEEEIRNSVRKEIEDEFKAKVSELENKVSEQENKIRETEDAKAKAEKELEEAKAKLSRLTAGGHKPPAQDSDKSGKQTSARDEFFAEVRALMDAKGMSQEEATLAVQRDNHELWVKMIKEANAV